MEDTVLIPAFKPDEKMLSLLRELQNEGLSAIVVDDGSGKEYSDIFKRASEFAEVIFHDVNKGKGAALKTGIRYIKEHHPECKYFITADADGQHRIKDILKVREKLNEGASFVLTVRELRGDIPLPSKMGNGLSRVVYTLMSGHYFRDNQSGLRGFSADNADWLMTIGGDRYDYELSMIYVAEKQQIPVTTVPIDTVYIDGNKSSHFDPFRDTLRIYKQLFKTGYISLITFILWETAILICSFFFTSETCAFAVFASGLLSAFLCILGGKYISFSKISYKDAFRTFSCAALRSSFCCAVCYAFLLVFKCLPVFIVFNAALIADAFFEYKLYKLISK